MMKKTKMQLALQHLSLLVNTSYLIEDVLSEELYRAIEQLILNYRSELYPDLIWQTIRWDVSINFEYKEIWFAPLTWSDTGLNNSHLDIDQCYAYFKLTIKNHSQSIGSLDDDFAENGNRLPTVNFFNHNHGFVCIQFHLNRQMIKKLYNQGIQYAAIRNWNKYRDQLIKRCNELNNCGFKLSETKNYWYLPIPVLDINQVAEDYNNQDFEKSLYPIREALNELHASLAIFDQIQQQAKLYK